MSLDKTLNTATNQRHYDYIAEAWQHLLGQNFHWGYFESDDEPLESATINLIDKLVGPIAIEPGQHLLDVGCGIGEPARYLAEKFGCRVTGFSTSPEGIDRALSITKQAGLTDTVKFEVRDALDNQLDGQTFDSVFLLEMSHLIRDKLKLLIESSRPLRTGGVLSLCDLTLQRRLSAKEIVAHHSEIQILERCFGKARLEPLGYYVRAFEHCGYEDIQAIDISNRVTPTIRHWRDNAITNRAALVEHVSRQDVDDFVRSCDILQELYSSGAWGYGIISGRKSSPAEIPFDPEFDKALF